MKTPTIITMKMTHPSKQTEWKTKVSLADKALKYEKYTTVMKFLGRQKFYAVTDLACFKHHKLKLPI